MNTLKIGNYGINNGGDSWKYTKDLSLHYTSRSGIDLLETKSGQNLNAKILPCCGLITTSSYATLNIEAFESSDASGYIEARFYFNDTANQIILFSTNNNGNTAGYFVFRIASKKPVLTFRNGVTPSARILTGNDDLVLGWNTVRWASTGSEYLLTVNGVSKTFGNTGANDGLWLSGLNSPNSRDNVSIGASILTSVTYSAETFKIDYVDYSNKHKWLCTGMGTRMFDIIGTNHLTRVGTDYLGYDIGASTYLLDNGFAIWTKAGQPDEYVPYKNGLPMDSSLGIIGYEKRANYPGGSTIYNFAPSLIDFDYLDGANALLNSLDKSNTTYHISTGSMSYYDASNHYRWRSDELANPRVYSETYKKVGYRGLMCLKSVASNGLLLSASEIFIYSADKTGSNQWKIAKYCTIDSIVAQSGGSPVYDGNNYLTYNALPTDLTALSILFLGDSTMGNHASGIGQYAIFNQYTQFATYNIATSGETINQQKARWDAITSEQKLLFDYVLVQIGWNDLANSSAVFLGYYQALIDDINEGIKPTCKVVVSAMTPGFGYSTNEDVRTKILYCNTAILGGGATPITGFDYANELNNTLLADPVNYLAPAYDSGDHLHPNLAGRMVIYNNYLPYIVR